MAADSDFKAPPPRWLTLENGLALALAAAGVVAGLIDPQYQILMTFAGIYLIAAMGLNILTGHVGIISIAHGALVCAGAYALAIATVKYGVGFWPAAALSVAASTGLSVLLGLPALRLSSWYFVLITVAFALLAPALIVDFRDFTGGYAGVVGIPGPALFGLDPATALFVWIVIAAAVLYWLIANIVNSRFGLAMSVLREGAVAAEANGVSSARMRLLAFALSGATAGIAGAFYGAAKIVITPDEFNFDFSILFLFIVILGGPARLAGPIFGVAVFYALPEFMTALSEYRMVVFGLCLLAFSVFMPAGLAGALHRLGERGRAAPRGSAARAPHHDGEPVAGAALRIERVSKNFGGLRALNETSLAVAPGAIHVIVGPNGSGKTTLLNVLFGFYPASSGRAFLDDAPILGLAPWRLARLGVQRTFQTPKLQPETRLIDNVCFGAFARERASLAEIALSLPRSVMERHAIRAEARQLLALVGLDHLADIAASELTHGQQRLAEIARALIARPRLLLLDEPAAGLSMGELDRLGQLLKEVRRLGVTLVMVEHHVDLVSSVADHVTVLDQGAVLAAGSAAEVFSDPRVIAAYMGAAA
jgi:ABC-type branched-subunit amino acid transport system ATPase component/ABC-type branched-subunit amino acid transport system permease subunit